MQLCDCSHCPRRSCIMFRCPHRPRHRPQPHPRSDRQRSRVSRHRRHSPSNSNRAAVATADTERVAYDSMPVCCHGMPDPCANHIPDRIHRPRCSHCTLTFHRPMCSVRIAPVFLFPPSNRTSQSDRSSAGRSNSHAAPCHFVHA